MYHTTKVNITSHRDRTINLKMAE